MDCLVFTASALARLSGFSLSPDWFQEFGLPQDERVLKRVRVGRRVYLVERDLSDDDVPIIVINLTSDYKVFAPQDQLNSNVLDRIITVSNSVYTKNVVIPPGWKPHREDSWLSVHAAPWSRGRTARLHFECGLGRSRDLFVFSRTEEVVSFEDLDYPARVYSDARSGLVNAILTPQTEAEEFSRAGIILSQRLPQGFVQGATLDQWYRSKLTEEQRRFVDKPYDGPVRLRGSAGTGKTLSLVIKFLKDGLRFEKGTENTRLGFLTHSLASGDLVSSIVESLDPVGLIYGMGRSTQLEVRTIYDLAHEHLRFSLDNLQPLSLDGREGRRMQLEIIEQVLSDMWRSNIVRARFSLISQQIKDRWAASVTGFDTRFSTEIMNEFASVLDAEGIRAGEERGESYVKSAGGRPAWLLPLPTEADRRYVLEIHKRYRETLGEMNTLSVDQMVGDFDSFLNSNRWDRVRNRQGYDALFVDELHLFTSVERQLLHKLIKTRLDEDERPRRPPIFMAYDLKQSPWDTFTEYSATGPSNNIFTSRSGLQNSDLVQLTQVFRYTPQIAEFLADLDAAFPAIDIPGEWNAYVGEAEHEDGDVPELKTYTSDLALFKDVFSSAMRAAHDVEGGGRRVAVLCASAEMFDSYLTAASGQFKGKLLAITSREPSSELRHAGKRFIFSMPEYVAGLQFDTVFLIHVNASEAPMDAGIGIRRQFISTVYLGASRAEKVLSVSASTSRGGASDILNMSIGRGSLLEVK